MFIKNVVLEEQRKKDMGIKMCEGRKDVSKETMKVYLGMWKDLHEEYEAEYGKSNVVSDDIFQACAKFCGTDDDQQDTLCPIVKNRGKRYYEEIHARSRVFTNVTNSYR